jgi:hypothetical protein
MKKLLLVALLVLAASSAACNPAGFLLLDTYTGPGPETVSLTDETVIVHIVEAIGGTDAQNFYVDRVRYLEEAPNNINRVVQVTSREITTPVRALNLAVGDRIRISTRYQSNVATGDLGRFVPNWSFDRFGEYLLGFHVLLSVERVPQ